MATNFVPTSLREATSVGSERLYFFQTAYEDYIAAPSNDTISSSLIAAEKELNIAHSSDFSAILSRSVPSKNVKIDPFDMASSALLQTHLREQGVQYKSGLPYVDLCVILGQFEEAKAFAKTYQKDYDVLRIPTERTDGTSKYMSEAALAFFYCTNSDSARLTALIYRTVDSSQAEYYLVMAELWSLGFHWDAYCLAKLKYPDAFFTVDLAKRLKELLPQSKSSGSRSCALQEMLKSDSFNGFTDDIFREQDPIWLYRLLKCLIMKNELCSDESRRLNGRMKAAVILRQLAVSIIIKIGHTEAVAIFGDMLAFLKTKPALLGDLFNLKERMLLEKCIGMLGAVYSAISRVSFTNGSANNQALVKDIKDTWHMLVPDLWRESAHRDALKDLGSSLGHSLSSIERCFVAPYQTKANFLKHSINFLCDLVGSPNASSQDMEGPAEQKFTKLIDDLGLLQSATPKRPRLEVKKEQKSEGGASSVPGSAGDTRVGFNDLLCNQKPSLSRYPANTVVAFQSGGFEVEDGKPSNFGKWALPKPQNNRGSGNGNQPFRGNNLNKSFGAQQLNSYRGGNGYNRGANLNSSFAQNTGGHRNGNGLSRGGDNLNKSMHCGNF